MSDKPKLNPRQEAFVKHYLILGNATKAAEQAGYSKKTANEQAARLLANVSIRAALDEAYAARRKEFNVTEERLIKELASVAFTRLSDLMTWDHNGIQLKASDEIDDYCLAAIQAIEEINTEGGGKAMKVKQYDKLRAIEMLGKRLGIWNDDRGKGTGPRDRKALLDRVRAALLKRNAGDAERSGSGGGVGAADASDGDGS